MNSTECKEKAARRYMHVVHWGARMKQNRFAEAQGWLLHDVKIATTSQEETLFTFSEIKMKQLGENPDDNTALSPLAT